MRIALASDHAGYKYKTKVKRYLIELGYQVEDFGTHSEDIVDYPDFIRPAAIAVAEHKCERGIIFGGSGNGEAIVANRIKSIRCALCWNVESARLSREHNNSNMLSIGQRLISWDTTLEILDVWLNTEFQGGRHERRIELIDSTRNI
jgi:ribose 5-phosphate isomerase B